MHIGLVPHIPDQFVLRKIKEQMKRHRQFHRSQVRRQMSPGAADALHQTDTDLLGKPAVILRRYLFDIIFFFNRFQ